MATPRAEESAEARRERRKRSRWGEETEAGKKVLEETVSAKESTPGPATQEQQQQENAGEREGSAGPPSDAAPRKRRTRWEPEEQAKVIPGLPTAITLPASLAHLVDINPETLGLQVELNQVR